MTPMSNTDPALQNGGVEEIMRKFNDAFQRHDPSGLEALVAVDCVIENTTPAPNGSRHVGREACVALWTQIATTPDTSFDLEGVTTFDDRAIVFWRYRWGEGDANSVKGVNIMRVRQGQVVEALGYVKGS